MASEDDLAAPMEKIHTLPFNPPVFDWNSSNLYTQFRIFQTKVDFAFDGTYKNNQKDAKVVPYSTEWVTLLLKSTLTCMDQPR